MPTIRIDDFDMYFDDQGQGTPLLLVHGFPLDYTMWRQQIRYFSSGKCRVITPDLRGFGRSTAGEKPLSMRQLADDLAVLIEKLGIRERIVLCGLSMGGYVALQFCNYHAALLKGLILCDTRSAADSPEGAATRLKAAEAVLKHGSGPVVETMMPKLLAEQTATRDPDLAVDLRRVMTKTAPATIAAAQRGMAQRPDMTGELKNITVPALVICGQHDAIVPPAEMQKLANAIPQSTFLEVPNVGHMAPLEDPGTVNAAMDQFLASLLTN